MIILPRQQNWQQTNDSDNRGSLFVSKGLDFSSNWGRVRLGKRMILNTNSTDVATLNSYPVHFELVGSNIYTIAGNGTGYAFYAPITNPLTGTFARDTDANAPATVNSGLSDAVMSNAAYYVTTTVGGAGRVHKKVLNLAWSTPFQSTTYGGYPNMLCSFKGRTYMSDFISGIISWDVNDSVASSGSHTAIIDSLNNGLATITKLVPDKDKIWVLTMNQVAGRGYVYEWDGAATSMNRAYVLESAGALAGCMFEGVLYIMDTEGRVQAFTGGTFKTVGQLNREHNKLLYNPYSYSNNRFVHPNGMTVIDGKIHILIDNRNYDSTYSTEETIPAGVWTYDSENGLTHKYALSMNKASDTLTDFGSFKNSGVGALHEWNYGSTSATRNGSFFAGATYLSDATTTKSAIFYDDLNDTLKKSGYLVTSKISALDPQGSVSIKNTWQSVLTFRKLLNSDDKIVVKCRSVDEEPLDATITWTSTTSFTTTTNPSAYWTAGVGGEVEIMTGTGAGICAHIISITGSGTYTVTIDETIPSATGTSLARFQSWKKVASYSSQQETYVEADLNNQSNWVQLKVFMWWTGRNELESIFINNNNTLPANK